MQANSKPCGWLKAYLETQMDGLTGHMEQAGFPYDERFWGADTLPQHKKIFWWPFEQTAYYIDGFVRAAIALGKEEYLKKAEDMVYSVLRKPDADGYLGPKELKDIRDNNTRWSHVVFFRACLAMYEHNGDKEILTALTRHYLGCKVDHSLLRNVLNVEIMLEVFRHTGNKELLAPAEEAYTQGLEKEAHADGLVDERARLIGSKASKLHVHGVTYNEYAKLGAMLYRATGKREYLACSTNAMDRLIRHYMLPGGCNSSSEYTLTDHYDECYETCDIADLTWTLHYLAEITGESKYYDMLEKCVFNAGIGSVTEDFRALQYFSCANQLVLTENSSLCRYKPGGKNMTYSPMPFTACCPGNVNRIMPNYALSQYLVSGDTVTVNGYAPGFVEGDGFSITQTANYPFSLAAKLEIKTEKPLTLRLRVPAWCRSMRIGAKTVTKAGYTELTVKESSTVSITFDARILQKQNRTGVYFEHGPLVYSLGMKGRRDVYAAIKDYPSWRMMPDRPWNYAICSDGAPKYTPGSGERWDLDGDLPHITVTGRQVLNWHLRKAKALWGVNGNYEPKLYEFEEVRTFTPHLPRRNTMRLANKAERITLYPYGACKLRMTVLPACE